MKQPTEMGFQEWVNHLAAKYPMLPAVDVDELCHEFDPTVNDEVETILQMAIEQKVSVADALTMYELLTAADDETV